MLMLCSRTEIPGSFADRQAGRRRGHGFQAAGGQQADALIPRHQNSNGSAEKGALVRRLGRRAFFAERHTTTHHHTRKIGRNVLNSPPHFLQSTSSTLLYWAGGAAPAPHFARRDRGSLRCRGGPSTWATETCARRRRFAASNAVPDPLFRSTRLTIRRHDDTAAPLFIAHLPAAAARHLYERDIYIYPPPLLSFCLPVCGRTRHTHYVIGLCNPSLPPWHLPSYRDIASPAARNLVPLPAIAAIG